MDIATAMGWRVEKHPRLLAQLTPSGKRLDIVGFGDCGVWTALSNGNGTFQAPRVVLPDFGEQAGRWRVDKHPRFVVDINGDGHADIVGFGDAGIYTARGNGDGTFQQPVFALNNFGVDQSWRVDKHPRFVVDINGDGHADIVGFGDAGVWTALTDGDGGLPASYFVHPNFGWGTIVLAITRNDLVTGSRGIWRSTDGGSSWMQILPIVGQDDIGQLQWAPGSDHLVYAQRSAVGWLSARTQALPFRWSLRGALVRQRG